MTTDCPFNLNRLNRYLTEKLNNNRVVKGVKGVKGMYSTREIENVNFNITN